MKLNSYFKSYRFKSIFFKYFVFTLVTIMLPLTILSSITFYFLNDYVQDEIKALQEEHLSSSIRALDTMFLQNKRMAAQLTNSHESRVFFLSPEETILLKEWVEDIVIILKNETLISDHIDSIYFYSTHNNLILTDENTAMPIRSFYDNQWLESNIILSNSTEAIFEARTLTAADGTQRKVLSLYWPVQYFESSIGGYVLFNFNIKGITKYLGHHAQDTQQNFFVLDDSNNVLYNKSTTKVLTEFNDFEIGTKSITDIIEINGKSTVYSIKKSKSTNLQYLMYNSLDSISNQSLKINMLTTSFILWLILLMFIISFIISKKVYSPVKSIMRIVTDNIGSGIITTTNNQKQNEIDFISESILHTISNQKSTEKELADKIVLLNQAYSSALQSQINPHFLHNTLETIRIMAMLDNHGLESDATRMIERLSDLFRISMNSGEYLTTIEEEVSYAQLYLEILKPRNKNSYTVTWDIDPDIYSCKIIKLSLQPLIENAIEHGIKSLKGTGEIKIRGYLKENTIIIIITDNGVGIPSNVLEELTLSMNELYQIQSTHIGMLNTNQRIKLLFGDKYGIDILSSTGQGTEVYMTIPYIVLEQIDKNKC